MSLITNNPEALSWKYPNRGGISTREGVITALPSDIILTQADVDSIEVKFSAFMAAKEVSDNNLAALQASDADMARVFEDFMETSITLGRIPSENELPVGAQAKLIKRRERAAKVRK